MRKNEEQRQDWIDWVIMLQDSMQAVANPLEEVSQTLLDSLNPSKGGVRKPTSQQGNCVSCKRHGTVCSKCERACPVGALEVQGERVSVSEGCLGCGACVAQCPSEALLLAQLSPEALFKQVSRAASSHEEAYLTCAPALGRPARANEIALPCLAAIDEMTLFSCALFYPNLSVYLPVNACRECSFAKLEVEYLQTIAQAEQWLQKPLNLVMQADQLNQRVRQDWRRQEFVESITKAVDNLLSKKRVIETVAVRAHKEADAHTARLRAFRQAMLLATGERNLENRPYVFDERLSLFLASLASSPQLAERITLSIPAIDQSKCTFCGACEAICPFHCISFGPAARPHVEGAYCTSVSGCSACFDVCPEGAITWQTIPAKTLLTVLSVMASEEKSCAQQEALTRLLGDSSTMK